MKRALHILSFLLFLFFTPVLHAQWESLSSAGIPDDLGGDAECIAAGDGKLFLGLSGNGIFYSSDNGTTWSEANNGFDPATVYSILVEDTMVYAAVNRVGVFRSSTRTIAWEEIGDGSVLPAKDFLSLAILNDTLYLGTKGDYVYMTDLAFVGWKKMSSGIHNTVNCLAADKTLNRIYAGTGDKNNLSVYEKGQWRKLYNPVNSEIRSLAADAQYLLIGTNNGLYSSHPDSIKELTYSSVLQSTGIELSNILALQVQENKVYAALFGYVGSGPGVYVADLDVDNQMSFINYNIGFRTPRPIIRGLAMNGTTLWAAVDNSGPYAYNEISGTWSFEATGIPRETTIHGVIEHQSKLYALTSIGVYESSGGNGGDWALYSMEGKDVGSFLFASSGSEYAIAFGVLFKDGAVVEYDTGDEYPLNSSLVGLTNVYEHHDNASGKNYIFVGSWQAGYDGYAGVYRTTDDGATWNRYGTVTSVEDGDGLHDNNRIIASTFSSSSDGKIYTTGKHVVQITSDLGENYTWRKGNNNMPSWGTTSNTVTRFYKGKEYLFLGMEDYWYVGRSEVGETVASVWERADGNSAGNKAPKRPTLTSYSEDLLFARAYSGNQLMKTEDNGDNWYNFNTGIDVVNGLTEITIGSNHVYTSGSGKSIYRYDMVTPPSWNTAPSLINVSYTNAALLVNASRAGTAYYAVVHRDSVQPSNEQIMQGLTASGLPAPASGSQAVMANDPDTLAVSGLALETDYSLYTFIRSEVILESSTELLNFTTLTGAEITFHITDGMDPVESATVTFNGSSEQTGVDGSALFPDVIPTEDMPYSVTKEGYIMVEDTLDVTVSETVEITMIPIYDITFSVEDAGGPVSGATVLFNAEEKLTDPGGQVIFADVPGGSILDYTVSKESYIDATGNITVSRDETIDILLELAPICATPVDLQSSGVDDVSATVSWSPGDGTIDELYYTLLYRESGEDTWNSMDVDATEYAFSGLTTGTEYEVAVNAVCTEGSEPWSVSLMTDVLSFRTITNNNCQDFPVQNPVTVSVGAYSAVVSWDNLSGVSGFEVRYQKVGLTEWQTISAISNTVTITSLDPETSYQWQVRSVCEGTGTQSDWTASLSFTTQEETGPGVQGMNPIAAHYNGSEGYPTWTDRIQWGNRIDMSGYSNGANDFEKFENARDELYSQGGGVLYYPEGVYDFTDAPAEDVNGRGLMLKKGVVILGETPTGDAKGTDGTLELKTKFVFKFIQKGGGEVPAPWNIIGLMADGEELKDVDDVGIAWVQVEGATVFWGYQMEMGDTYGTADAWLTDRIKSSWTSRVPDGTFPMDAFCGQKEKYVSTYDGAGSGRFVFGCQFNNSIILNDVYDRGFGPFGFSEFKYGGKIMVYGSHVFIANNIISKPTKSFLYTQNTSEGEKTIIFDYGFSTGIDVNKNNINVTGNRLDGTSGYFEPGIVVQDNYIYNHGMKTMDGSGNWITIKNNYGARDILTPGQDIYGLGTGWTLTGDGYKTHQDIGSSDAFQNRGYDLAGKNMWIDSNYYEYVGTAYPSNDGEGILAQRHGGTDIFSWAMTRNYDGPAGHRSGYIGGYDVHNYGCLIAWNDILGSVGHIKAESNSLIDVAFVDNICSGVNADCGGDCDYITDCPAGALTAPTGVSAEVDMDNYAITVTWTDASDAEIGFRVERRIAGADNWKTIAYRPRHSQGHAESEQKWIDFMAPAAEELEYRVVAVNCNDDDSGASEAVSSCFPVKVSKPAFSLEEGTYTSAQVVTIKCSTEEAEIRYTTDGSDPDETSTLYSDQLVIDQTTALKAKAFKGCNYPSEIASATYTINLTGMLNVEGLEGIRLYPNPAREEVILEALNDSRGNVHVRIFDHSGRKLVNALFEKQDDFLRETLDISRFRAGMYFIEISLGERRSVEKLIRQ